MKDKPKIACYVGKFQPFHLGHYHVLLQIASYPEIKLIKVVICGRDNPDPFNYKIRKKFIRGVVLNKKIKIYLLEDSSFKKYEEKNDLKWIKLLKSRVGSFDIVYANRRVKKCLKKNKCNVGNFRELKGISGTKIRQLLKKNNPSWKSLVLPHVSKIIINEKSNWGKYLKDEIRN